MAEVVTTSPAVFRGRKLVLVAAAIAVLGFILLAIGLVVDPGRAWLSYLWVFTFAFSIAVGALIFLMIAYATNARWMSVVRRATELVMLPLPALAVLFVPVLFGLGWLYPWHTPRGELSHHELEILEHRHSFMNSTAFAIRAILYFAVLLIASLLLRRWSLRRDRAADAPPPADPVAALGRERRFASGMLPAVAFAFTFAVIDWVMSLQAVWYSTIFGIYLFAGGFLSAIAIVTIYTARLWMHQEGHRWITRNHFHALGRLLFAFTVFWTYAAFFQAMLIKIANKPEEVTFYIARTEGAWWVFVWILIVGHFLLPFLFLMPRAIKFRPQAMAGAGAWLVLMHLVDTYWIVIPAQVQGAFPFHWLDLGALAAVLGTCVAVAAWRQRGVTLVAERDPFIVEGAVYRSPL